MSTPPADAPDGAPDGGARRTAAACPPRDVIEEFFRTQRADRAPGPEPDGRLARMVDDHVARCDACAELVASIRADDALLRDLARAERGDAFDGGSADRRAPVIPGYDLGDEIARGGQGIVVRGVQRSTGRPVAIKLLTDGRLATSRQRRRFEHEIEAVSALRHPGIVTLYDGGIAEETPDGGVPWFAMEFVRGERLDDWALAMRDDPAAIVEAFTRIVEAVAAAHRSGVIHRDLKPGNILVDGDGQPRVLDFGLAVPDARRDRPARPPDAPPHQLLDGPRERGFVGTPAYAAPEQLRPALGPIDARTDVYALGLILHELLVGRRPFEDGRAVADAVALRNEVPPPTAPLRAAGVDADLIAIIRRAAAPSPADRYDSAAALVDDLQRRRTHHPVSARGEAAPYMLGRFARRHRVAVALLAAIAALLIASTIVTSTLLVQRDRQRQRAERSLAALTESLVAADPLAGPGGPTAVQFIDAVAEQLDRRFADDRRAADAIRRVLGGVSLNLGDLPRANLHFEAVLKSQIAAERRDRTAIAAAQHDVARVAFFAGDLDRAEGLYRDSLATRRRLLGGRHPDVATSLIHLASCRRRRGDLGEAESLLREALSIRRAIGEPNAVAATINNLGSLRREMRDLDGAHDDYSEALELLRALVAEDDWRLAHVLVNLASVQIDLDRLAEAALTLAEAERILQERVEPAHPKRLSAELERVRLLVALGEIDAAERAIGDLTPWIESDRRGHAEVVEALHRLREHAARAHHPDIVARLDALSAREVHGH